MSEDLMTAIEQAHCALDDGNVEKAQAILCAAGLAWNRRTHDAPVEAALTGAPSEPQRLDPVVEANRALLHKRSQVGIQKYGVTLDEGRYGEREILQHALEEALDLANYLQARIQAIQSQHGESAS